MRSLITKALIATSLLLNSSAFAFSVNVCSDESKNHMTIDSSWATSCIDSGIGNISGNATSNDAFLANYPSWSFIEKSEEKKDQDGNEYIEHGSIYDLFYTPGQGDKDSISGTWSVSSTFWNDYSSAALGFKFGTGDTHDEWFVFELAQGVTSGNWTFISTLANKGGLSHINLYSTSPIEQVSEPVTIALFGLGLAGLGFARRRIAK